MYEAFYGLREKPFNLTPDPKYLYLSDKHKEAFAHLLFGIKNRSGFVMLTGEIGTGKTTICRNLLNQIDPDTQVAFIFNPSLNAIELLKKVNDEFGIDARADNALELVETLNQHLLAQAAKGMNCVLVIDEAQNLTPPVLEQIRLLSNLETEKDKLLQIILIGQPELGEMLQLRELRQLNQRITARYHLKPLTEQETLHYIAYRLHVAGGRRKVQFDKKAVRAVYRHAGGVPRMINAISDRCLLIGYTKELRTITAPIVRRAAAEIRGEKFRGGSRRALQQLRRWLPSPAAVLAVLVVVLIFHSFIRPLENISEQVSRMQPEGEHGRAPVSEAAVPETRPSPSPPTAAESRTGGDEPVTGTPAEGRAESFASVLLSLDPVQSQAAAARAVLGAWDVPADPLPAADTQPMQLAAYVAGQGLRYELRPLEPEHLTALNMPAFVRLRLGMKDLWVGLVGEKGGSLRVSTRPGETATLSMDEFRAFYARQALVPWRDPNPGQRAMVRGASSQDVAILKEALRRLGRLSPENASPEFDGPTYAAIRQLQAETGMEVDGIAGPQVRMVLSSWLPEYRTPALREGWAADIRASAAQPAPADSAQTPVDDAPPAEAAEDTDAPPELSAETAPVSGPTAESEPAEMTESRTGPAAEIEPADLPGETELGTGPAAESESDGEPASNANPAAEPVEETEREIEPAANAGVESAPGPSPAPPATEPVSTPARNRRKEATEPVPASAPLVPVSAGQTE